MSEAKEPYQNNVIVSAAAARVNRAEDNLFSSTYFGTAPREYWIVTIR